jgi:hypothetical protein
MLHSMYCGVDKPPHIVAFKGCALKCAARLSFYPMQRGPKRFMHTLKLSHSLQKEFDSPYEHYVEYLLDVTEGFDIKRLSRDQFDSSRIRALDKSPRWVLWIRDSIWQKFKKRQAALRGPCFGVTNSQLVRILLEMKRQLHIPVIPVYDFIHYTETKTNQLENAKETSRAEASRSTITSQCHDNGQFVLGDNLPPLYTNADTLTSCNPHSHQDHSSTRMIIRNLITPPISDKDEPKKQANTTPDQELYNGKSRPLPNWLAKLIY